MRKLRLRKYRVRNKKVLTLLTQILVIWYASIYSFSLITSNTSASFSDKKLDTFAIQAGTWWDKSDLEFIGRNTQNIKQCPPTEISVEIINKGFTMTDATTYEVYYSEKNDPNPKKPGEKIYSGELAPIIKGKKEKLTFRAEKEGSYLFKAYQREGYQGENKEIWSEKVMVQCIADNKIKQDEDNDVNEQNELITEEEPAVQAQEDKETKQSDSEKDKINDDSLEQTKDEKIIPDTTSIENSKNIEESNITPEQSVQKTQVEGKETESKSEETDSNIKPNQEGE